VTANELHIPVRTPVRVEVRTADVIHSFWVPELNRKIDTIPGTTNAIELDADAVGSYRGQCVPRTVRSTQPPQRCFRQDTPSTAAILRPQPDRRIDVANIR